MWPPSGQIPNRMICFTVMLVHKFLFVYASLRCFLSLLVGDRFFPHPRYRYKSRKMVEPEPMYDARGSLVLLVDGNSWIKALI